MLSSNWQVALRLTVFEIFAVKWPKFKPKISDFGDPLGHRHQKERKAARDRYVPSCKISRRSVPPSRRYLLPDIEKKTTETNIPFHANVWRRFIITITAKRIVNPTAIGLFSSIFCRAPPTITNCLPSDRPVRKAFTTDVRQMQRRRHPMTALGLLSNFHNFVKTQIRL